MKLAFNQIRTKLLTIIIGISIFVTGMTAIVGFNVFENTLISEIGDNRSDVLSQISNQTKRLKNNLYTISYLYYYDQTLMKYIQRLENEEDNILLDSTMTGYIDGLTSQFKKSFAKDDVPYEVMLLLNNGYHYTSYTVPSDYNYMNVEIRTWYQELVNAEGEIIEIENYKDESRNLDLYGTARTILDSNGNVLGYLMVMINEEHLYNLYSDLIIGDREIYVVAKKGKIISSSNRKINGFEYFNLENLDEIFKGESYCITQMDNKDILFTQYYEEDSEIYVMEVIGLSELLGPIYSVRGIMMLIFVISILIACIYAFILANRITTPLSYLCDFIVQVNEENMDKRCSVTGYAEIEILKNKLNNMLDYIVELMDRVKLKEKQKRELELSFLQAQINPHFMYNTLFSVKCMVDMQKNEEASEMLVSFIALLRKTLSNPDEYISIMEEFDVLSQYVKIQQLRYSNQLEFVYEYDDNISECKMPKLLLQPLVENAIFHGIELKKEGIVIVTAKRVGNDIQIKVEDNGIGIDKEKLKMINQGTKINNSSHIGIENIRERIQLNFGEKYGLLVESEQWKGTCVTLCFPVIEGGV